MLPKSSNEPYLDFSGPEGREPMGVGVVQSPGSFPCATMAGMMSVAAVTGNSVTLQPSEHQPLVTAVFVLYIPIIQDAKELGSGLGTKGVGFVAAIGSVGDYLVEHPKTQVISFTGSKAVGLGIIEKAARVSPGQTWTKRVAAEMGGKDCTIVDSEADMADAVEGVAIGAFGFQGQKCSACSRSIAEAKVYEGLTGVLTLGPTARYLTRAASRPRTMSSYQASVTLARRFDSVWHLDTLENDGPTGRPSNVLGGVVCPWPSPSQVVRGVITAV